MKILTGILERGGELTRESRNTLLASMHRRMAHHVLEHNYDQTLALTLLEGDAVGEVDAQIRCLWSTWSSAAAWTAASRACRPIPRCWSARPPARA
ncbi:NAD-glutamate dehydrogenase domain-containing protein [Caulobacter segnis]